MDKTRWSVLSSLWIHHDWLRAGVPQHASGALFNLTCPSNILSSTAQPHNIVPCKVVYCLKCISLKFLKVKLHRDYIIAIWDKQLKYGKVQKSQKVKCVAETAVYWSAAKMFWNTSLVLMSVWYKQQQAKYLFHLIMNHSAIVISVKTIAMWFFNHTVQL